MAVVSAALEKRRAGKLARVGVKDVTQPDQPLTAAAALIPLDGTGWKTFKLGDAKWQRDAWHQYDINGDLRTIGNWIGKACSRARLYLAKVDATGRPGEEVTDPKLQIIAETMFGSPSAKAEAQRLLGIHLFVPGESFIVAEAADNANDDRWYVVSTSDIRREGERTITVRRPQQFGGGEYTLKNGVDLLIRCWTPHPDKYDMADSSVRPGLIPLRAIEQYTKMEFAEVDSRLAGAGILFVPEEMDFPTQGKEKNDATGLTSALTRTMSASMVNREDASSMVPIVVQVPGELIGQIQHITFFSDLQQHLAERMDQAVNRLARTLEIEPEILTGKADMNHWSAWQVDESTISIHVTPLLSRMCDALTAGYVRAALQVLGEDPDAYVLWYDTSMLTVEPDRQKDGLEMWDKGLISSDAVRKAGSWAEGDKPDDEEEARRIALHLVDLDPSKIEWDDIRTAIGGKVAAWKPPEPEPVPGADVANGPAGATQPDVPGGGSPNPDNVRRLPERPAQSESRQAAALRVGAHMAVRRALELVGKRLLTRPYRDRYADVPAHELHTRIRVGDPNRVNELLASADGPAVDLAMVAEAAELPEMDVASLLSAYCGELVQSGVRHNADLLATYLAAGLHAGCDGVCYAPAHPGRCGDDARMQFHLPGLHNQKDHGRRKANADFLPFNPSARRKELRGRREHHGEHGREVHDTTEGKSAAAGAKKLRPAYEKEQDASGATKSKSEKLGADLFAAAWQEDPAARERVEAAMRAAHNFTDEKTGMRAEVGDIWTSGGGSEGFALNVEVQIYDRDGNNVGTAQRKWHTPPDLSGNGKTPTWGDSYGDQQAPRVYHDQFALQPQARQKGFATRWNAHAKQGYRDAGIDAIATLAVEDGKYAWAKEGYQWKSFDDLQRWITAHRAYAKPDPLMGRKSRLLSMIKDKETQQRYADLARRSNRASWDKGEAPSPGEWAALGWTPRKKNWAGKDFMLDLGAEGSWSGVLPLFPDGMTAAASNLTDLATRVSAWWTVCALANGDPDYDAAADGGDPHEQGGRPADDVFWAGLLSVMADEEPGEIAADESMTADAGDVGEWWESETAFHLPGRHNQKTHGHRVGKPRVPGDVPGTGPFTEREKRIRAGKRRSTPHIDPDRNAPAPDRQGKRAFAEWSAEARRLALGFDRENRDRGRAHELEENKRRATSPAREMDARQTAADRQQSWKKIEDDMERERARRVGNILRNGAKHGYTPADIADHIEGINASTKKELARLRELHFAENGNPPALRSLEAGGDFWTRQLNTDTGFAPDAGVPVEGRVDVNSNIVRNGYAFRQGGVTYLVESTGFDGEKRERREAAEIAEMMHNSANRVLPPDHAQYQWGVAWLLNNNSGDSDGTTAAQYGGKVTTGASASPAARSTVIFRGMVHRRPNSTTDGYMRHEFGHHFDNAKQRFSNGSEWRAANSADWDRNNMGGQRDGTPGPEFSALFLLPQFVSPNGTHKIQPFTNATDHSLRVEQPEGVTTYGKATRGEDFAESIALHHAGQIGTAFLPGREAESPKPLYFRDIYPNRAAIFDQWWPEIAEKQRAAILRERG